MRDIAKSNKYLRKTFVQEWFSKHPFVKFFSLELIMLTDKQVEVFLPMRREYCTSDNILTGGMFTLLANTAGVTLAMMNSEYFTPLAEIKDFQFLQPIVWDENKRPDKCLGVWGIAEKKSLTAKRIVVKVQICQCTIKASGTLKYARLGRSFEAKTS